MSTYWGLRCESCSVDTDCSFNHGEEMLACVVEQWPAIQKIRSTRYLDVIVEFRDAGEVFGFLEQHYGHTVVLLNEYGKTQPLKPAVEERACEMG